MSLENEEKHQDDSENPNSSKEHEESKDLSTPTSEEAKVETEEKEDNSNILEHEESKDLSTPTSEEAKVETEEKEETPKSSDTPETEVEPVAKEQEENYENFSKEDFVHLLEDLENSDKDWNKITETLNKVKPLFDGIVKEEKEKALEKFLANGGEKDGFEYRQDETTESFYQKYKHIRKLKSKYKAKAEEERHKNLEKKNTLLEKLRNLTDAEEDQSSLEALKELQEEWRSIGPVPSSQNRDLWARYNALVELFYNRRSIHFELKELDRKKNLSKKIELCEKAEGLLKYENIKQATKELNELHEEWKHTGPVPKEDKDVIWHRFKAASDAVYDIRREHFKKLKEEREENLKKKEELCEKVEVFAAFDSDRITEWNQNTKEIIALQKEWEGIKYIPKDKIKEVSKSFWGNFKTFFNNKNEFFKKIDKEREENLKKKEELCEKAEAVINSDKKPKEIAESLKQLQRDWKNIGPAPNKFKQEVYERFKKICDNFFESRRQQYADEEKTYQDNLEKKQSIIQKIDNQTEEQLIDLEQTKTMVSAEIEAWSQIGFVPKKDKAKVEKQFQKAVESLVERMPNLDKEKKDELQLYFESALLKSNPAALKKLESRENTIRGKIRELEDELSTLRNNIEFFAKSKSASNLKESFEQKISVAQTSLNKLKMQLRSIRDLKNKDRKKKENKEKD